MIISPPKYINTDQLATELAAVGFTYAFGTKSIGVPQDQAGVATVQPAEEIAAPEMKTEDEATFESVVNAHVAMRDKTTEEYAAEFQDPNTSPARKQEIRDIQSGLLPPEQVPMP